MERAFLVWNIPNWITVVLMVALGWLLFAVVSRALGAAGGGNFLGNVLPGGFPGASLLYGGATAGAAPLTS